MEQRKLMPRGRSTFCSMATAALLTVTCIMTSLPACYPKSLETNVTADPAVSSSLAPSVGGLEMRKLRHIEAELEVLRRTVTELRAGGQCGSQSPHPDLLKEVTTEIQGLRSQFQALQMRRDLSALRSDIVLAQSMLADSGRKQAAMLQDDASQPDSAPTGRPGEASSERPGAVYKRWGNDRCPNGTELVYSGVVGGSSHAHTGAAANALCLPLTPVLENKVSGSTSTLIYGAELEVPGPEVYNCDPLCAVCRAPRATTIMVPATKACHPGWTLEYSGYLMAGHHSHPAATEFLCVDNERLTRTGSKPDDNGFLFYLVAAACGSLPCPPYENEKMFPCVVCSK